jgi:hypothetical protein
MMETKLVTCHITHFENKAFSVQMWGHMMVNLVEELCYKPGVCRFSS